MVQTPIQRKNPHFPHEITVGEGGPWIRSSNCRNTTIRERLESIERVVPMAAHPLQGIHAAFQRVRTLRKNCARRTF
jgi:hypothetical protein